MKNKILRKICTPLNQLLVLSGYYLFLLFYDFICFYNDTSLIIKKILIVLLLMPLIYLLSCFMFNTKRKTDMKIFTDWIAFAFFIYGSIYTFTRYLIHGFNVGAFVFPMECMIILKVYVDEKEREKRDE